MVNNNERYKLFLKRAKEQYGNNVEQIYDYNEVEYLKARSRVTIRCIKHDIKFTQRASTHIEGAAGCHKCKSAGVVRSIDSIKEDFERVHKDKYTYDWDSYVNTSTDMRIKCPIHNWFSQRVSRHMAGGGCGKCNTGGTFRTIDSIKEDFERAHKDRYTYDWSTYKDVTSKIKITCAIHGDFYQRVNTHSVGHGCPKCGTISKTRTAESVKADFERIHKDKYTYDWSTYIDNNHKMRIKCPIHNWFTQRVSGHLEGKICKQCAIMESMLPEEEALSRIKGQFRGRYTYDKIAYVNVISKVIVTCKEHGDFLKTPSELFAGRGCPKCRLSKSELTTQNILDDNNIEYVPEYKIHGYSKYRYDLYLPKLKLLIELDGIHHYKPIEHYGGIKNLLRVQENDKLKDALAAEYGYHIARIPYTEFKTLDDSLFRVISKFYKYRVGNEFFSSFVSLLVRLKAPATTTREDVVKYLTYKG